MAQNFFEELQLQEKKQRMTTLINKAGEIGWLNKEEQQSFISKLENDVLTIGVIGQMKAGKSTFLNSFVFGDDILPAATTPMTAALSVITYGPEKKLEAEFYTEQEWQEQQMTARMNADEVGDDLQKSKIKAAQELMEKSVKLGSAINSLLGKHQTDSFENLIEYVGADGRYVSITKSVTVYYPMKHLKGVRIVDTPGFNDPILSREERTKEFLKQADVVLLMLYAGRPFDSTDRTILFKNIGDCGIGKVLIGVNKYDLPYETGEAEEVIKTYVKTEIANAAKTMGNEQLNDILRDTEPIPISAEMALLSELTLSKINESDIYLKAWNRHCNIFEISSQQEMREKSHLDDLITAIRIVIEREKETILFKKPFNAILAKGNNLKSNIEEELIRTQSEIEALQIPDDELEERESILQRVTKRLNRKIDGLGDELDFTFNDIVRKGGEELEDAVDACCRKLHSIVDAWGKFENEDRLKEKLTRETQFLSTRTLVRICNNVNREAKHPIKRTLDEFFIDAEDLLSKLPVNDEFDVRDFIKDISNKFNFENEGALFSFTDDEENDEDYGFVDLTLKFADILMDIYTFGLWTHGETVSKTHEAIDKAQAKFDGKKVLSGITRTKDKIISEVKEAFIDELLSPLQEQLDEVRQIGINKAQRLDEAKSKLESLKNRKTEICLQIQEITMMN